MRQLTNQSFDFEETRCDDDEGDKQVVSRPPEVINSETRQSHVLPNGHVILCFVFILIQGG